MTLHKHIAVRVVACLLAMGVPISCGGAKPPPMDPLVEKTESTSQASTSEGTVKPEICPEGERRSVGESSMPLAEVPPSTASKRVRLLETGTDIQGRLFPSEIKRVVRANFGRFRHCYELALEKDPQATGLVTTIFIIGGDGRVESAASDGAMTALNDNEAILCIQHVFACLTFRAPDGGKVRVKYPINFSLVPTPAE